MKTYTFLKGAFAMPIPAERLLETGEVVSTHGLRGEIKILPWADSPAFLLHFDEFYIDGKAFAVQSCRVHKTCVLAKLRGIDDVDQAAALRGKTIFIDRDQVELDEDAVFIADLIGLRVIDQDGRELGKIAEVLTPPANDVYVVRSADGNEYMIPVVEEFVKEIDLAGGKVHVQLISGIADDLDDDDDDEEL